MQFASRSKSGSESRFYSAPASPQRLSSVTTAASASTSSTSLSQIHLNSYFGVIPEESEPLTEALSGERADPREGITLDASSARSGDDDDRHVATNSPTSSRDSPVLERRRALRRRSKPILTGSIRPRLAIERRSSEKLDYPKSSGDIAGSERETKSNVQTSDKCCSRKAAFTSCFGSKSPRRFENELTFVAEPNPLRSLAMSRRLLASSSFNSLSFVSFKHDDDCSTHHGRDRNLKVDNGKAQIRCSRQYATVSLKSDLHDKKAVRLHATSSSLLGSPTGLNPFDRLRRTSSAPVTLNKYDNETGTNDAYIANSAQDSVEKPNTNQPSCCIVARCITLPNAAKDDDNKDDEEAYRIDDNDDDGKSITFLHSWRTSSSGDRYSLSPETEKMTGHTPERFLPPLKIWVIRNINEVGKRGCSIQEQSTPKAANQRTGKSNQAGPATTHTDVHVVALLPTESPGLENSGDFPRLTTAQIIETNETTYEVIWQENVRNCVTGVNEKQPDEETPVKYGQSLLKEEHGLDKVTRKLESWFWQDWTRDETSKEKMQDTERSDKLSSYNGIANQYLSPLSTTTRSMIRADVRQGDDNVAVLAVPPNSMQSSQRSSRNPSSGYADDCEVAATTVSKLHHNKLYRTVGSKQESIASPITTLLHARPQFTSSPSSPLPSDNEYQIPPIGSINHELTTREANSIATPEAASSSHEHVCSTAVRRLSNLTMSELTFRKHRDSLLLTRQRILPAGGGIGASVSSAWPTQDSIILTQKRLLRARKAQSNQASGSTQPMVLASPATVPIDTPQSRPQPAIYRLSALNGLSPILDVSPPAEHGRSGMMTCVVDNKRCGTLASSTAATIDKESFDKQRTAGLVADSDGGGGSSSDAITTANTEMPILIK